MAIATCDVCGGETEYDIGDHRAEQTAIPCHVCGHVIDLGERGSHHRSRSASGRSPPKHR